MGCSVTAYAVAHDERQTRNQTDDAKGETEMRADRDRRAAVAHTPASRLSERRVSTPAAVGLAIATVLVFLAIGATQGFASTNPAFLSSFGPDGTSSTAFGKAAQVAVDQETHAVYVLDAEANALYRFNAAGEALDFGGAASYIAGNEISGLSLFTAIPAQNQVAVDSQSHVVYVTSPNSVRAFQEDGEPAEFAAGPGAGTSEITGFTSLGGIAVDGNGDIYASDFGPFGLSGSGVVSVYASTGAPITQFETAAPGNLAVATDGGVYVARREGTVLKFTPSEFPATGATEYTAAAQPVNPDSHSSPGLAVDPGTNDLYIIEVSATAEYRVARYDSSGKVLATFAGQGEEGELSISLGVAADGESGRVYVSDLGTGATTGSRVEIFGTPVIPVLPPTVKSTSVTNVTSDSANLEAQINPNTLTTSYHFSYGLANCAVAPGSCTASPSVDLTIGSGHEAVGVARHISGLQPGTTYHYQVVAHNSLGPTASIDQTFTTQTSSGIFSLPDGRAWELVSPADKLGGGVITPPGVGPEQAATTGDAFSYVTHSPIQDASEGNRALDVSQSLSRHGVSGWDPGEINPPHETAAPAGLASEYRVFSSDLSKATVEPLGSGPLSIETSERTPYLRENFAEPAGWKPLVTGKEGYANVPPGVNFGGEPIEQILANKGPVRFRGANPDLSHIVVASQVPLSSDAAGAPIAPDQSDSGLLYEWADGPLHLVSVLPPDEGSGVTTEGIVGSSGHLGAGSAAGAVSNDGRYVYWSTEHRTALYVRDLATSETARVDVVQTGASGGGESKPIFQGADADGTRAVFTDTQQLTENASSSGADLYECTLTHIAGELRCDLHDVTPAVNGETAQVQGLVSAVSETGKNIYFVANGALAPGAEAGNCTGSPGTAPANATCNLYVARLDGGAWNTKVVAQLSQSDSPDWGMTKNNTEYGEASSFNLVAAGSPNGRYFAFMSKRSLTGYDNRDAFSLMPDQEVFLYDSSSAELRCVSCNPTAARPAGVLDESFRASPWFTDWAALWSDSWLGATLPEPNRSGEDFASFYHPRTVLDNGRVVFNSFDSLVPADGNGSVADVYEFESLQVGNCTTLSGGTGVAAAEGGCVSLISSGNSSRESGILDASASGDDIFFATAAPLSPVESDLAYDIYDAHVCGTGWACPAAPPTLAAPCSSAGSCRPVGAQQEEAAPPSSSSFSGKGNVKAKHHKKKHHKKKHHKKKHHKKKHHKKAGKAHKGAGRKHGGEK
jgi:hypothetical protein